MLLLARERLRVEVGTEATDFNPVAVETVNDDVACFLPLAGADTTMEEEITAPPTCEMESPAAHRDRGRVRSVG